MPLIIPSKLPWTPTVEGADIVVRNIFATCFGGDHDDADNGETESGVKTRGHEATLFGCALPIRSVEKATASSPLAFPGARIPWGTRVSVWVESEGEKTAFDVSLIDNGPNVLKHPSHALDITPAAAHRLRPSIPVDRASRMFSMPGISYRIHGAAQYAPNVIRQ